MRMLAIVSLLSVVVARAYAQKLERSNPDGLVKNPNYSQVVKAGKLLFVAGQTGVRADGKVVGPGMKEQYEQVLKNIEIALKANGADLSNVATMTTYVTDMDAFREPQVVAIRSERFGKNPPASTLVQVVRLAAPEYKVEVEAIAVLP